MRALLILAAVALTACSSATPQPAPDSTPPSSTSTSTAPTAVPTLAPDPEVLGTVVTGLAAPWSVAVLGTGAALMTHRDSAKISLLRDGAVSPVATVDAVFPEGEGGLLGIALPDPTADTAYVYYTSSADNRIAKFDWDGTSLTNQQVIFEGIPKAFIHNGGRIAFGPDGYLYVATGDAGESGNAPNLDSLGGKILRLTKTGEPAPGNPYGAVWSLGHRNVQGLAWDDAGRLWATEFGQEDVDELNLIERGGNYGWPECEGSCQVPGTINPAAEWSPTATASPSGLAIVDGSAWIASLRGETLYEVPLDGTRAGTPIAWFAGEFGRLRDVVSSPDGTLWVVTNNTDGRGSPAPDDDRIIDIRP